MNDHARPDVARLLADEDVLALTLHHEAAGDGLIGMTAVACVIRNRLAWGKWGSSYADVCLYPKQFSCWRPSGGTTNYERLRVNADALRAGRTPQALALAFDVAQGVIAGAQADITGGADHYYAPLAMLPKGRVPAWAESLTPCAEILRHVFFRLRPVWPARIGDAMR